MIDASGGKIARVAREMRLHDSSAENWVCEAREAKAGHAPIAAERAEIRELKAELERVTRERDILGKAVDRPGGPPVWMKSLSGRLVMSTALGVFAPVEKLDGGGNPQEPAIVASSTHLRLV